MKYITFRHCYILTGLWFLVPPLIHLMTKGMADPFPFINQAIVLFFNLFFYLGYIKYASIIEGQKLKMAMLAVIALRLIGVFMRSSFSIVVIVQICIFLTLQPDLSVRKWIFLATEHVPFTFECLMLFYAFIIVNNEERSYFSKLGYLSLCLAVVEIIGTLLTGLISANDAGFDSKSVIGFVNAFIVLFLLPYAYMQFKLFKHLHIKYESGV